jgi:hypothetical protein
VEGEGAGGRVTRARGARAAGGGGRQSAAPTAVPEFQLSFALGREKWRARPLLVLVKARRDQVRQDGLLTSTARPGRERLVTSANGASVES